MRLTSHYRQATSCRAMTLAEVLVAVMILAVVVWGAVAFVMTGRTRVEWAAQQRTAAQIARERLERARSLGYASLAKDKGQVFVDTTLYSWTLTVTSHLADPADGSTTYKQVEARVDWPTSLGQPVVLRTGVAP